VDTFLLLDGFLESYAVLTRLPAPHRLRPEDAAEILAGSFQGAVRVAGLPPEASWDIVSRLAGRGVAGGRTYDELILASALGAGATRLITFNPRHFDPQRIEIAVPGC
jgi:predicted nucleic acid-binding protein